MFCNIVICLVLVKINNINVIYQWDANPSLNLMHSLHIGNLDAAGADFIGLQNIAEIKETVQESLSKEVSESEVSENEVTANSDLADKNTQRDSSIDAESLNTLNTTVRIFHQGELESFWQQQPEVIAHTLETKDWLSTLAQAYCKNKINLLQGELILYSTQLYGCLLEVHAKHQ